MKSSVGVVAELKAAGQLWEPMPGLIGFRGALLELYRRIEALVADIAVRDGFEDWRLAPGISLRSLDRAEYFESFPQWLTAAGHLTDDPAVLEDVARSSNPARAALDAVETQDCALSPALCYHTYERLAGRVIESTRMTAQGTCWRHEGARFLPLERGWAFTMRELVFVGDEDEAETFRQRGIELAQGLADRLDLGHDLVVATDPFFAPTARGKEVLQRLQALKHELVMPLGDGRSMAVASFNHHQRFFGQCFDISLGDGTPASSACVAFGLERWLLAYLVAHGTDPSGWPESRVELSAVESS